MSHLKTSMPYIIIKRETKQKQQFMALTRTWGSISFRFQPLTYKFVKLVPLVTDVLVAYLIECVATSSVIARLHTIVSRSKRCRTWKGARNNLTSKLLFLAVESCSALTQISATSAQLIPYIYRKVVDIVFCIAYHPQNLASDKQQIVHGVSPGRFCSLDRRSARAGHQVLPETI